MAESLEDLDLTPGVLGCREDDLLEEIDRDEPGTGEGDQDSPWFDEVKCLKIDVFVPTRSTLEMRLGVGEFGGIEDHGIEAAASGSKLAERSEGVTFDLFGAIRRNAVE